MDNYDWNEIIEIMKSFARVEGIRDIIIIGDDEGVRRILLEND